MRLTLALALHLAWIKKVIGDFLCNSWQDCVYSVCLNLKFSNYTERCANISHKQDVTTYR